MTEPASKHAGRVERRFRYFYEFANNQRPHDIIQTQVSVYLSPALLYLSWHDETGAFTNLFAQVSNQQLPQDVMEVDLGGPLHGAVGEQRLQWFRGSLQPVIEHRLIGRPQYQGILKQHGQRVDVDVEGQHDASGEEGVGLAVVSWKQRQPDFHACLAAGQPQGLQQVALLPVGATGGPNILHTLGQHYWRTKW